MGNIVYAFKHYYYGDDINCPDCILLTYTKHFDGEKQLNYNHKHYCTRHTYLDFNKRY